ncbi:MAG: GNAT family N-acetyltransferase [Bacteroidota bacterium]
MNKILETDRLILRELTNTDSPFIYELLNSPGWLQYIGNRNINSDEDAQKYIINGPIKSYESNGYGLWLVSLKTDNSPIGLCGILKRDALDAPDIGFAFLDAFMDKGYAVEIAKAVLDFANHTLKLKIILGITALNNTKSIKLLEKIGLKYIENIDYNGELLKLYKITF